MASLHEIGAAYQREIEEATEVYRKALAAAVIRLEAAVQGVDLSEEVGKPDPSVPPSVTPSVGNSFATYSETLEELHKGANPFVPERDG